MRLPVVATVLAPSNALVKVMVSLYFPSIRCRLACLTFKFDLRDMMMRLLPP